MAKFCDARQLKGGLTLTISVDSCIHIMDDDFYEKTVFQKSIQ